MRALILIATLVVAQPLLGQRLPLAPHPNIVQLQETIDKSLGSNANSVLVMDLDSVMLYKSAGSIPVSSDPDATVRQLVGNLKSIQLRVFDVDGDLRTRLQSVRDLLKPPSWVRYSAYTSRTEQVEIWSARSGSLQTGVFLLSITGRRVFMMNVGGNLSPDQLVYLSGVFGIPNFKPKLDVSFDSPGGAR